MDEVECLIRRANLYHVNDEPLPLDLQTEMIAHGLIVSELEK